jgi:hypothetical protein
MMNRKVVVTGLVAVLIAFIAARAMQREQAPAVTQVTDDAALQDELTMERPIEALNSIWIEELTWIEIRDRMADGTNTVIIPTGGIEQNGPYVAMGKHNYVLQGACEGIARELGNALCAPIVKLVPEGGIEEHGQGDGRGELAAAANAVVESFDSTPERMRASRVQQLSVKIRQQVSHEMRLEDGLEKRSGRAAAEILEQFLEETGRIGLQDV